MFSFSYIWVFLLLPLPLVLRKLFRPYQDERPAVRTPFFDELVELSGQVRGSGSIVRKQPVLRQIITAFCWETIWYADGQDKTWSGDRLSIAAQRARKKLKQQKSHAVQYVLPALNP